MQRAGAVGGKGVGLGAFGALVQHHLDDLRDHVAGALQDHGVAHADVLARDLIGIVQGGVLDHHPAHGHRAQARHRRDRPGAADLDVDGVQHGAGPLGRELAGDGPARRAGDEAEPLLPVQPVDLVDHPVDIEGQLGAFGFHAGIGGQQARRVLDPLALRRGGKAPGLQLGQGFPLGVGEGRAVQAPGIGEEGQGASGGDGAVDLAQGAGGGVAGVGVGLLAGLLGGGVERRKGCMAQIDLAADLDLARPV